jgi:hypothetical protein
VFPAGGAARANGAPPERLFPPHHEPHAAPRIHRPHTDGGRAPRLRDRGARARGEPRRGTPVDRGSGGRGSSSTASARTSSRARCAGARAPDAVGARHRARSGAGRGHRVRQRGRAPRVRAVERYVAGRATYELAGGSSGEPRRKQALMPLNSSDARQLATGQKDSRGPRPRSRPCGRS